MDLEVAVVADVEAFGIVIGRAKEARALRQATDAKMYQRGYRYRVLVTGPLVPGGLDVVYAKTPTQMVRWLEMQYSGFAWSEPAEPSDLWIRWTFVKLRDEDGPRFCPKVTISVKASDAIVPDRLVADTFSWVKLQDYCREIFNEPKGAFVLIENLGGESITDMSHPSNTYACRWRVDHSPNAETRDILVVP